MQSENPSSNAEFIALGLTTILVSSEIHIGFAGCRMKWGGVYVCVLSVGSAGAGAWLSIAADRTKSQGV